MGSAPTANVATVYASVDGLTGSSQTSLSPPLHILHAVTRSQQKSPEFRKILYCRWRKTALTRGSYRREAGGIVGAVRDRRVEGMARMGVDGVCGGALVDIVVDGVEDTKLDEHRANALRLRVSRDHVDNSRWRAGPPKFIVPPKPGCKYSGNCGSNINLNPRLADTL